MSKYSIFRLLVLSLLGLLAAAGLNNSIPIVRAQQNVSADLTKAQALYYDAQFQPAIDLLLDLEKRVANNPLQNDERLRISLYLGLSYLGLSQNDQARQRFVEVCSLDEKYAPNPQEFSPKVISLFQEAKAICAQNTCTKTCSQIDVLIASGNFNAAQNLVSANAQCPCAAKAKSALISARFQRGRELYDGGRFGDALREFNAVLTLDGEHDLAKEYTKLAQQRLDLGVQQAFSDWKASYSARQYDKATAAYDRLKASEGAPAAAQFITQIEAEYQKVLTETLASWKVACATSDKARMDSLRRDAATIVPRSLNTKALADMGTCTQKGCMRSDPQLAMNRLTTRVNPRIDPSLQRFVTRGIRVAIQIDVDGRVEVKQIFNANDRLAQALRSAVEQWKFYPAIVDNEPRCVETELPINLIQP